LQGADFFYCVGTRAAGKLAGLIVERNNPLNAELCRKALEKVGNPNVLVNLISRRVRQLNAAGAAGSHPLIDTAPNLGAADIALLEIVEEKMGWEMLELAREELVSPRKRKRS
jgi:DNA-directed RNA polymerase subunit omega